MLLRLLLLALLVLLVVVVVILWPYIQVAITDGRKGLRELRRRRDLRDR